MPGREIMLKPILLTAAVVACGGLVAAPPVLAYSAKADTTWVTTFDQDFYNWATAHVDTFLFPPANESYGEVLLFYTIACPGPPGDCDPWDRLGHLRIVHEAPGQETVHYEIARIVTPYDITGGSYPESCTWVLDVTDYRFLLHDEVVLRNYIESWIGGDRGWLVTIEFAFIAGTPELEAYQIVNLWTRDYLVYGDPTNPLEDHLPSQLVEIDPGAEAVKVRAVCTGHGQGNTDNAAEFSYKWHRVVVDGHHYQHYLWRSDCAQNSCSPQGGTWQYNRAGWCPGDKVVPWDNDITTYAPAGATIEIGYEVTPYENLCRPNNPDCIDGVTCPDCDYNYTGHTEPHYSLNSQLIFYRSPLSATLDQSAAAPERLRLGQNYPNPFNPATTFAYTLDVPGDITISIFDPEGKLLRQATRRHRTLGTFRYSWNGKDERGVPLPSGVYIYQVQTDETRIARKMILLK
jgi:hypothetical protein